MPYPIEFQASGLIFTTAIIIIFFSKPRWKSVQNSVFSVLVVVTWIELAFDIASTITIAERANVPPALNTFFAKGYIIAMQAWIMTAAIYNITNTFYESMTERQRRRKKVVIACVAFPWAFCAALAILFPLEYAGGGRVVYSYGIPSLCTYAFSGYCVAVSLVSLIANFRHLKLNRRIPTIFFTVMQGAVALLQMNFPSLLLVGFGTSHCLFIIYSTMENPDVGMIAKLDAANRRSMDLLLNILPEPVALSLQETSHPVTKLFSDVTIAFIDIVGFTRLSSQIGAERLVEILNSFFSELDDIIGNYRIEKIKTIGDAYMVVSGLPEEFPGHCEEMMRFCIDVMKYVGEFNRRANMEMQLRIGVNSGQAVAGIIGKKKFIYDLWGSTVNLAARMESSGVPGRIQVSQEVFERLKARFKFVQREPMAIKGVGLCLCYLLDDEADKGG